MKARKLILLGLFAGMFLVAVAAAIQAAGAPGWLWVGLTLFGVWVFPGRD